jgi:hypothetical protein
MLTHNWIIDPDAGTGKIKKKNTTTKGVQLSLKELLAVSSDWKEANFNNPSGASAGPTIPIDFQ